jgi:crotonobetainyl-CoA:carnitine CoA-transferase CaiB-like acyl-CoA transferase
VYIFTSPANPEHWTRLLKVMGREELIGDKRYDTPAVRADNRAEVDAIVTAWTRQHDKHTAARLVSGASIPAGPVLDTRELYDDTTLRDRKIRQTMQHPAVGEYVMSGWPVRFGGEPPAVKPAPLLGEHSGDVLGDWLKMDQSAIGTLKAAKVIAG